jgi:hypothetical protein
LQWNKLLISVVFPNKMIFIRWPTTWVNCYKWNKEVSDHNKYRPVKNPMLEKCKMLKWLKPWNFWYSHEKL